MTSKEIEDLVLGLEKTQKLTGEVVSSYVLALIEQSVSDSLFRDFDFRLALRCMIDLNEEQFEFFVRALKKCRNPKIEKYLDRFFIPFISQIIPQIYQENNYSNGGDRPGIHRDKSLTVIHEADLSMMLTILVSAIKNSVILFLGPAATSFVQQQSIE